MFSYTYRLHNTRWDMVEVFLALSKSMTFTTGYVDLPPLPHNMFSPDTFFYSTKMASIQPSRWIWYPLMKKQGNPMDPLVTTCSFSGEPDLFSSILGATTPQENDASRR